jgi:hypothetical protein
MTNPIQAMFEAGVIARTDFPPESRYHGIARIEMMLPDGRKVAYLRRRIVPPPTAFATRAFRRVKEAERLDHIAAQEIGSAEAFWQFCDSNGVLWAEDLEEVGREVRITLPAGVPGGEQEQ